jgi:hypothetical protein
MVIKLLQNVSSNYITRVAPLLVTDYINMQIILIDLKNSNKFDWKN